MEVQAHSTSDKKYCFYEKKMCSCQLWGIISEYKLDNKRVIVKSHFECDAAACCLLFPVFREFVLFDLGNENNVCEISKQIAGVGFIFSKPWIR